MSAPSNIERPGSGSAGVGPEPVPEVDPAGVVDPVVDPAAVPEVVPAVSNGQAVDPVPVDGAEAAGHGGPGDDGAAGGSTGIAGDDGIAVGGRGRSLAGRLARTVVALAIVVGLVLLVPRPNAVPLQTIDIAEAARGAAPELGFEPSVPSGPPGWTPTIALVRHGTDGILTWHVGLLTSRGAFVGIDQATRSNFTWENALDSGGMWVGTVEVDGRVWDHMEKVERDTTSLILRRPGRVTLVTAKGGGVPDAVTLIRSLPPDTLS